MFQVMPRWSVASVSDSMPIRPGNPQRSMNRSLLGQDQIA